MTWRRRSKTNQTRNRPERSLSGGASQCMYSYNLRALSRSKPCRDLKRKKSAAERNKYQGVPLLCTVSSFRTAWSVWPAGQLKGYWCKGYWWWRPCQSGHATACAFRGPVLAKTCPCQKEIFASRYIAQFGTFGMVARRVAGHVSGGLGTVGEVDDPARKKENRGRHGIDIDSDSRIV